MESDLQFTKIPVKVGPRSDSGKAYNKGQNLVYSQEREVGSDGREEDGRTLY